MKSVAAAMATCGAFIKRTSWGVRHCHASHDVCDAVATLCASASRTTAYFNVKLNYRIRRPCQALISKFPRLTHQTTGVDRYPLVLSIRMPEPYKRVQIHA